MPGPSLPLVLAAAVAVTVGTVSLVPASPPAEPAPTASHRSAAGLPGRGGGGQGGAGLSRGAAAAVEPPAVPAAAAPSRAAPGSRASFSSPATSPSSGAPVTTSGAPTTGRAATAPARGPAGAPSSHAPVAGRPGVVPARGRGWRWPLDPPPAIGRRFEVGPFPWSPGHRGVDLVPADGGPGATVLAAGPGVVRFAGVVAGRGVVSVDHGNGLRTTYEPVRPLVVAGRVVAAGTPIGVLEAGGHCAPAACLHWGAVAGQQYVDPLSLLRPRDPPVLLPLG